MAIVFTAIAAFIHIYIFCLESILWGRPKTNRTFGVTKDVAEYNRGFAFNQGFYNLFLAVAAIVGLGIGIESAAGKTLVTYALMSMALAALVLIYSNKKLIRPALIQGLPPLLGLITLLLSSNIALAEEPSSLQKHLEKYPNSGWSCVLKTKHYRAELSDESKCKRLGGQFAFAKDLKRDAPTLDQIESKDSRSERANMGHGY